MTVKVKYWVSLLVGVYCCDVIVIHNDIGGSWTCDLLALDPKILILKILLFLIYLVIFSFLFFFILVNFVPSFTVSVCSDS